MTSPEQLLKPPNGERLQDDTPVQQRDADGWAELHGETRPEVDLVVSEEAAAPNTMTGQTWNKREDWRQFNQMDVIYSTEWRVKGGGVASTRQVS